MAIPEVLSSPWQLTAFWCAASLIVYASQRLAEYVSLSVDQASRRVFISFASVAMGCLCWALVMAMAYLHVDMEFHAWTLLPGLSALVVVVLCYRLTLPALLARTHWGKRLLASLGMSAGMLLAYAILVTNGFSLVASYHWLPLGLAFAGLTLLMLLRAWRHETLRLRGADSPHATTWGDWVVSGGFVVLLQWLLSLSFEYSPYAYARGAAPFSQATAWVVVAIFTGALSLEQFRNIRADRGRQHLLHRGLSMIRSSTGPAALQPDAQLALIADYLHELLVPQRLTLHFQPIANLRSGVLHFEALLRLEHPRLGRINPESFFLVCELRGRTQQVDRLIVCNALAQAQQWRGAGHAAAIQVNVAPVTLMAPGFDDWLVAEITQRGLALRDVRLELTEHAITANGHDIQACVSQLHARGIELVMDDFGAGYSSLGLLANLPLASIKCDRLFLRDVANDARRQALLRHVAAMAHELDLSATIEGVETEAELRSVLRCGIDSIQGYLLARPMPAHEVEHWLAHEGPQRLRAMQTMLEAPAPLAGQG